MPMHTAIRSARARKHRDFWTPTRIPGNCHPWRWLPTTNWSMSMTEDIERKLAYSTKVEPWFRATCHSPISGTEIEVFAPTIAEARRRVDLALVTEAHTR